MIYVHVHMWRQVSLCWETCTKLITLWPRNLSRVLILESMKWEQLSLVNDGIMGMALGGTMWSNWISHHISVLVLIQSLMHLSGTLRFGSIDSYYMQKICSNIDIMCRNHYNMCRWYEIRNGLKSASVSLWVIAVAMLCACCSCYLW